MSIIEEDDLNVSQSNSDSESLEEDQEEYDDYYHDTLETENLVLRRNMTRLYDVQGQDITNTFIVQERIYDLTLKNEQFEFKLKEMEQKKRVVKTTQINDEVQGRASNTEVESSSTVDDQSLQLMEHFSGLKKEMLNMFEALQGILPFLEKLVENNSETSLSNDKIKKMKKEFYKCLHEISIKIINVEDLEKTLNESLKHQHGHTQTGGNDTRELIRLQNEVDTLRTNLKKEVETKDYIKLENASLRGELRSIQDEKMTIQKELMDVTEKYEKLEEEHAVIQEQMENGSQNHETVELLRAKQRIQKLDSKIIATTEENENLVSLIEKLKKGIEKQEKIYGDALERIHVELEQLRNSLAQNQQKEGKHQLQEVENVDGRQSKS